MKKLAFILLVFSISSAHGGETSKQHYSSKLRNIAMAISVGNFSTEKEYLNMLETACKRNLCSSAEQRQLQVVGTQLVACQTNNLKHFGVSNQDVNDVCETKLPIQGCDSLATPLLRKMCYSGNKYDLKILVQKERHMQKRLPAQNY